MDFRSSETMPSSGSRALAETTSSMAYRLKGALEDRSMKPISRLVIIDIDRGVIAHRLYLAGIRELYDTAVLVGVTRPKLLGIQNDEIRQTVTDASFPRIVWRARHS